MTRRRSIHPFAHTIRAGIVWGAALFVLALLAPSAAQAVTPPCVSDARCQVRTTASNGDYIILKGFATNCGDGIETLVITLSGPGGTIGSHGGFNVTPGGQAEFDTVIVFTCTPGAQTVWTVSAVAQNAGGTSQPVSSTCSTLCISAGTLHCNNANGLNLNTGSGVSITGVVTELSFTATAVQMYVQDATGGIGVSGANSYCPANLGDNVTVTGEISQVNGLTQVGGPFSGPLTIVVNSMGNPDPAPLSLTPAQVNATFQADYCEPNESRLVQVTCSYVRTSTGAVPAPGATFEANTRYQLVDVGDPASNCTMFISKPSSTTCPQVNPLIGTTIPTTAVLITGVLSQFDTTSPFTSGYEVIPRLLTDLATCQPVPTFEGTWGKLKSRYR